MRKFDAIAPPLRAIKVRKAAPTAGGCIPKRAQRKATSRKFDALWIDVAAANAVQHKRKFDAIDTMQLGDWTDEPKVVDYYPLETVPASVPKVVDYGQLLAAPMSPPITFYTNIPHLPPMAPL
jgi:hypothetical protein